jgi:hypothetical protein
MNTNALQTIKARKIAKACESITAEEFLCRFDHLLMLAMRMAERTSQRDIDNPDCPSGIRGTAMEDKETWQVFADTIDRLRNPVAYAANKRANLEYLAKRYCDAN